MADELFKENQKVAYEVQNMFKGGKKKPTSTTKYNILPGVVPPIAQPQDVGVGRSFISRFVPGLPQADNDQVEMPIEQETPVIRDINQIYAQYKDALTKSGFKTDEENMARFMEQNQDPNATVYDFEGVEPQDNIMVKAPAEFLKSSILGIPPLALLAGFKKPLEVLGDAFSRWEAAKVGFVKGIMQTGGATSIPQALTGITGTTKTEFPEASLRGSNLPEFGDFLRSAGVPEVLAAAGGLTADVLFDIPFIGPIGKAFKLAGKGSVIKGAAKGIEQAAEATTEQLLKMRSARLGRAVIDMAKGKSAFDVGPAPAAFKQAVRTAGGETSLTAFDASALAGEYSRILKTKPNAIEILDQAQKGNLDALAKFTPAEQAVIKQGRAVIDRGSKMVKDELSYLQEIDPKRFQDLDELIDTVANNQGHYTTRAFELFTKKNWKPSAEKINTAIEGLIKDGASPDYAKTVVKNLLDKSEVNVQLSPSRTFKIGPNAFKSRQPLPEYMLNLLGEIKDPRFNIINTSRKLSETHSHLRLFRWMRENGYVSPTKTAEFTEEVTGKPLAWGAINGMYTSPEIADSLKGMQGIVNNADAIWMKGMQVLKTFKTVFNPKAQGHNWMGSLFFMAPLTGVSVFNKPQRYKEAIQVIKNTKKVLKGELSKSHPDYQLYRQALGDRAVGTELPLNDQITWLENFIKNDFQEVPGAVGKMRGGLKKVARVASESYALGDVIPKLATYIDYTKYQKMPRAQAVEELYKWFQNPAEVSRLAQMARSSGVGLAIMNPFMSFRSEAHRILINALKESPRTRMIMAGYLASHAALNASILGMMGMGLKDIGEFFMTRPEAISETVLNPANPEGNYDLNTRYIDPYNTRGLFAPLLALSGATGVNPFDYVLDFTAFSPDFGYSNLAINALTPALAGSDRRGEDLSFGQRIKKTLEAAGPSSIALDIPKGIVAAGQGDNPEAIRRAFRFFGVDLEKRNPDYIKNKVASRLQETIMSGGDVSSMLKVLKTMGFNEQKMYENALRRIKLEKKKPASQQKIVRYDVLDRVIDSLRGSGDAKSS